MANGIHAWDPDLQLLHTLKARMKTVWVRLTFGNFVEAAKLRRRRVLRALARLLPHASDEFQMHETHNRRNAAAANLVDCPTDI